MRYSNFEALLDLGAGNAWLKSTKMGGGSSLGAALKGMSGALLRTTFVQAVGAQSAL
jgi:hypothetical protein